MTTLPLYVVSRIISLQSQGIFEAFRRVPPNNIHSRGPGTTSQSCRALAACLAARQAASRAASCALLRAATAAAAASAAILRGLRWGRRSGLRERGARAGLVLDSVLLGSSSGSNGLWPGAIAPPDDQLPFEPLTACPARSVFDHLKQLMFHTPIAHHACNLLTRWFSQQAELLGNL